MSRPVTETHARLRRSTLTQVRTQYPDVDAEALWCVEAVNGGYGRDALHLRMVGGPCDRCQACMADHDTDRPGGKTEGKTCGQHLARTIVVWRGQVVGVPRCEYCGREGHTKSTATGKDCPVVADEVKQSREAQARRMREHAQRQDAEAEEMRKHADEPAVSDESEAPF